MKRKITQCITLAGLLSCQSLALAHHGVEHAVGPGAALYVGTVLTLSLVTAVLLRQRDRRGRK